MRNKINIFFFLLLCILLTVSTVSAQGLFPFLYGTPTAEPIAVPHEKIERCGTTLRKNVYIRSEPGQTSPYLRILQSEGTLVWIDEEYFTDDSFSWYAVESEETVGFIRSDLMEILSLADRDACVQPAAENPDVMEDEGPLSGESSLPNQTDDADGSGTNVPDISNIFPVLPSNTPILTPTFTPTPSVTSAPIPTETADDLSNLSDVPAGSEIVLDLFDQLDLFPTEKPAVVIPCPICHEKGDCPGCHGKGFLVNGTIRCKVCGGTGDCPACGGTGLLIIP